MGNLELISKTFWLPLSHVGLTHSFFRVDSDVVIDTWIALTILLVILLAARYALAKRSGVLYVMVMGYVKGFKDLNEQTFDGFYRNHFYFISALFTFLLVSNSVAIVPWLEEPTKDLNTTLALSIISFLYTQYYAIKSNGAWSYIKEYFSPFFLMLPLNIVGKLATVISMSFRLFGNIYGGATIGAIFFSLMKSNLVWDKFEIVANTKLITLFALGTTINLIIVLFFGLFEGFIQAFVFSMLALTYLATAVRTEQGGPS